jgi:hypothetical protein
MVWVATSARLLRRSSAQIQLATRLTRLRAHQATTNCYLGAGGECSAFGDYERVRFQKLEEQLSRLAIDLMQYFPRH